MKPAGNSSGRARTWLIVGVWLLALAGFLFLSHSRGLTPLELLVQVLQNLQASPWAILWLLLIYAIRPLFLLPVSVLTVFAGFLFGVWQGAAWSLVASLGSAALAYGLARFVAGDGLAQSGKLAERIKRNTFETVLALRLASMPGDPINFLCGAIRAPFWQFTTATAIGGLPGLMIGVFAGASLEGNFTFSGVSIQWEFIAASALMLILGLLLSRWVRSRNRLD